MENEPYPANNITVMSSDMVLTADEAVVTGTIAANTADMQSAILYIAERDCPVEMTEITITDDVGPKDPNFDGIFAGMTYAGGNTWEFPTGAEGYAGAANTDESVKPFKITGGATIAITGRVAPAEAPTPEECEEGIHLEEVFGGAVYDASDCANPTYTFPAGANDGGPVFPWAGFADKIAAEGAYPYSFPYGGDITFTASADAAGQRMRFKFEREGFPGDTTGFYTDWVEVPTEVGSRAALSVSFGASEGEYNNFLMYLETSGGASVAMTGLTVTPAAAPPPPPPAPPAAPATPVPALPFWALLGLAGLVGLFGFRRR